MLYIYHWVIEIAPFTVVPGGYSASGVDQPTDSVGIRFSLHTGFDGQRFGFQSSPTGFGNARDSVHPPPTVLWGSTLWPMAFRPVAFGLCPLACALSPVPFGLSALWPVACGLWPLACGFWPLAFGLFGLWRRCWLGSFIQIYRPPFQGRPLVPQPTTCMSPPISTHSLSSLMRGLARHTISWLLTQA